jgi:hypothetical protein
MAYQILWEQRGVLVVYQGRTSDIEVAQLAREVQADARYGQLLSVLHDFRACTGATFTEPVVQELSATDGAASLSNPRISIAVVATHPEVRALVNAYIDVGLGNYPLRGFSEIADARAWLDDQKRQYGGD